MPYHYNASVMRICVDRIENGQISGRVFSPYLANPLTFTDVGNFLIQMEEIFDARGYPSAFQKTRSFMGPHRRTPNPMEPMDRKEIEEKIAEVSRMSGEKNTFLIYVITRQNATWQGKIDWLNGAGSEQSFKSALEMLRLIDARLVKGIDLDLGCRPGDVPAANRP